MKSKPTMSKNINKDIVLCETTSKAASHHTSSLLVEHSVPFTKSWKRVPFFKRKTYNGASTVCVISINKNQYSNARRALDNLEDRDYNRLILNVI